MVPVWFACEECVITAPDAVQHTKAAANVLPHQNPRMTQHLIRLRRPYRSQMATLVQRLRSSGYTCEPLAVGGLIDVRGSLSDAQLHELRAMEEVESVMERPGDDRMRIATP